MCRQQPRIQQVCALLTFGADVCTPHPSVELWFRVQDPMSPARSTPPQQGMWGQPPRTRQVQPPIWLVGYLSAGLLSLSTLGP